MPVECRARVLTHPPGPPALMIRPILRYGADALHTTAKPVEDFGTMAFDKYADIYRVGYDYTKERLADWQP